MSVRVLDLVRIVLGWSIMLVGAAIVVTAFGARTVRQYGEMGQWGATTATDGIRWFQGWALLCVLGTGIALIAALWGERPRWWLLAMPIGGFLLVARNTDAWHQTLRDEQAGPRTYPAEIPVRAPDGGPTLDAMGRPLHFEIVTRTYEIRIPGELDVLILGSLVAAALVALLMALGLVEAWGARRQTWRQSTSVVV